MQKITDVDTPVIGTYYLVPCAAMNWTNTDTLAGFIPTIGKKHTDKQFSITKEHYHIDGRFNFQPFATFYPSITGHQNWILQTDKIGICNTYVKEIVWMRKKCVRLTTGINPPSKHLAPKYWDWYKEQIGKSCKGKICPHLKQTMLERDGVLVCPLHGLIGDIKTEKIIENSNFNS